jgi:regulator of RNase E activity RraB
MEDFDSGDFSQKAKTEKTLAVMRKFGLRTKEKQEVEFFFYADAEDNASNLAIDLSKLGYEIYAVEKSGGNGKWSVIGCTKPIPIAEGPLTKWAEAMESLAQQHRCMFDGWGTLADPPPDPLAEIEE